MGRRKIIKIDPDKCDGCGLCVNNCVEGALKIVEGKARLVGENCCDGLGACLGECPRGAISIEEREAQPFDKKEAAAHQSAMRQPRFACPGSLNRALPRSKETPAQCPEPAQAAPSELANWPVQLKLVNPSASFLRGAELLLAADCVPFACADFHTKFLRRKPVIIGCPKLDDVDFYFKKLTEILRAAQPRGLTVIRMEVPCCGGLTNLARLALTAAQANIPLTEVIISLEGKVLR